MFYVVVGCGCVYFVWCCLIGICAFWLVGGMVVGCLVCCFCLFGFYVVILLWCYYCFFCFCCVVCLSSLVTLLWVGVYLIVGLCVWGGCVVLWVVKWLCCWGRFLGFVDVGCCWVLFGSFFVGVVYAVCFVVGFRLIVIYYFDCLVDLDIGYLVWRFSLLFGCWFICLLSACFNCFSLERCFWIMLCWFLFVCFLIVLNCLCLGICCFGCLSNFALLFGYLVVF